MHQVLENYALGIIVLGVILAIAALFIALHLRPLSKAELNALAEKRRDRRIADYYTFSRHLASPNPEFKKRMNADGRFYKLDESMKDFPALAAALLKYKKHEWIIIAFERQTRVCGMWLNKGPNRETVSPTAAINTSSAWRAAMSVHRCSFFTTIRTRCPINSPCDNQVNRTASPRL